MKAGRCIRLIVKPPAGLQQQRKLKDKELFKLIIENKEKCKLFRI